MNFSKYGGHRSVRRAIKSNSSSVTKYYFLVDVVRALVFSAPSSFQLIHLSVRLSTGLALTEAYAYLVAGNHVDRLTWVAEDYFLLLLGLLSDIISCQRALGPLGRFFKPVTALPHS